MIDFGFFMNQNTFVTTSANSIYVVFNITAVYVNSDFQATNSIWPIILGAEYNLGNEIWIGRYNITNIPNAALNVIN